MKVDKIMENEMVTFCIAALFNLLILVALVWMWVVIIRLYIDKNYRDCPPYIPSFGKEKKIIIDNVSNILKNSKKQMVILDPGCGTGALLINLAKNFREHHFIGIEWNKFSCWLCRLRARKLNNIEFICEDMFNYNFGDADIIVCFLMDPLMKKFGEKILHDNKKSQTIFSNTFKIPNLPLLEEIKTGKMFLFKNVYIYKL